MVDMLHVPMAQCTARACTHSKHCRPRPRPSRLRQLRTGTRRSVESIATGLKWKAVQEPLLCQGEYKERFLDDCRELGTLMAAGLEAGVF